MRFGTRNLYYLRISSTAVLPLYLYLDEKHVEWMSDRVLQQVLEDLRNRIPEKLIKEADAQLGLGGPANAKKGTLDVHRGDTYQFGYFLRNMEAHAVVVKTRRFVNAPSQPRAPPPLPPEDTSAKPSEKQGRKRAASRKQKPKNGVSKVTTKKRKTSGKGKGRAVESDDEEEVIDISSDEAEDDIPQQTSNTPAPLRRSSRKAQVASGGYREEDGEEEDEGEPPRVDSDVEMQNDDPVTQEPPGDLPFDAGGLITMDTEDDPAPAPNTTVKAEETDVQLMPQEPQPSPPALAPAPGDSSNMPLDLDVEEEEEKPKLIPKLKYSGFNIHGRCLCVIVEPYPPIRTTPRAVSLAPQGVIGPRAPSIAPADYVPPSVAAQRRARTPLFLPEEGDRERSVTPAPWGAHEERVLPPVPLFSDEPPADDGLGDGFEDGGMFEFSQILRSVGGYPAGTAEDDDEIDGAALFGDADEVRGL
ncbi:hypothetical protein EIP91_011380 [Steccherinum ochraceum]|uniref:Uncharacterized protein n=1 Tax=Steccherinum ochraceum TaxID=92696 RepID=A0A4R0RW73_9APHY|nr:hypothetical protein EIP91_011380 [Steccherinum ochraceum]